MCLFPLKNVSVNSAAYKKGVSEFPCGCCPECLRKKGNQWVVRGYYESLRSVDNCMICLTYDSYVRDSRTGKIIGEKVSDRSVDVRDVQLFIKRLRKAFPDRKIRYIAAAEYGKRTHRPHYHIVLFGVSFRDAVPYKRSKRGNLIYTSAVLTSLWKNGICTVDALSVSAANIRYCTKYAVKDSRADDTFMLCSQGLGVDGMLKSFNGISYVVEGREYPVPRIVWRRYFERKLSLTPIDFCTGYERITSDMSLVEQYNILMRRRNYYFVRDSSSVYRRYLEYWKEKASRFESRRKPVFERILALDDRKYHDYKIKALRCLEIRNTRLTPFEDSKIPKYYAEFPAPRSRRFETGLAEYTAHLFSCHKCADDTVKARWRDFEERRRRREAVFDREIEKIFSPRQLFLEKVLTLPRHL